jgi:penicillin-binding protein 2
MSRLQRQKRIVIFLLLFLLTGFAFLGRIFHLQVLHGASYARRSVAQRSLRYDYVPTGRGQIVDRDGVSLLGTEWVPVHVLFEPLLDEQTRSILATYTKIRENQSVYVFPDNSRLVRALQGIPRDGVVRAFEEIRYSRGNLATHVTGYIQKSGATPPTGLEKAFNNELSAGRPFTLAAFVDARGELVEGLGYRDLRGSDPRKPYSIVTTINSGIQAAAEQALAREKASGAIVVMDPKTGDILAMASYPQVNPWEMYRGVSEERMQQLMKEDMPFINRATQQYAPGSVFKVILAAAALEEGLQGLHEPYLCTGSIQVGDKTKDCYNNIAHGEVDLHAALTHSCNGYFIWLGQKLGRDQIAETAERFYLGKPAGVPLEEKAGYIPQPSEMPYLGDLANTSIGQGDVLITPLQAARMMAVIANDGINVYPRLVSQVINNYGNTVRRYPSYTGNRVLHPAAARRLQTMLANVVTYGTGRYAQSQEYTVAGKTGTAEKGKISHSWFAGYTEINGQTLATSVFLENRAEGSATVTFRALMEAINKQGDRF